MLLVVLESRAHRRARMRCPPFSAEADRAPFDATACRDPLEARPTRKAQTARARLTALQALADSGATSLSAQVFRALASLGYLAHTANRQPVGATSNRVAQRVRVQRTTAQDTAYRCSFAARGTRR